VHEKAREVQEGQCPCSVY